jgi:hypothetical protein
MLHDLGNFFPPQGPGFLGYPVAIPADKGIRQVGNFFGKRLGIGKISYSPDDIIRSAKTAPEQYQ